jgi:8-oxo-dGTP pyrophosphatase MutT (NUDIX family)
MGISKGGIGFLETKKRAIKREVKEETGLDVLKIKKFNINGKYKYDKEYPSRKGLVGQTFSLYAVEVKKGKIKLDRLEHSNYKWLEFEKTVRELKWPNQKKCMAIVHEWLKK